MNPHGNGNDDDIRGRIGRIEALIEELERTADPASLQQSRAIVQAVLEFHGAALAQILSHVAASGAAGRTLLDVLGRDELVSSLLLLHGLHPDDLAVRLERALDGVRPQLRSHGGDAELLGVRDGVVRLRMKGSCHGCPSSAATLAQTIEMAIYNAAPEVAAVEVEGMTPEAEVMPPLVILQPTLVGSSAPRTERRMPE